MCVFFSCSASYGHTPQRPHVVKVRGVFANDSNSPLRTKWVFPRSAVSDSTDIRRISSGGSYAEEEGRDGVLERNRECATSPFNYLTHKTIIDLNQVKFQSFISDVCSSVYRRRLVFDPPPCLSGFFHVLISLRRKQLGTRKLGLQNTVVRRWTPAFQRENERGLIVRRQRQGPWARQVSGTTQTLRLSSRRLRIGVVAIVCGRLAKSKTRRP